MKKKNLLVLLIAIFLYIPIGLLQVHIDFRRIMEDLEGRILLMPGQIAGSLVLGGFRGIAADLLWLNIEDFWHKGQHYKMLPLLDAVSFLQPHYITVWAIGGWHMSYNIYANVRIPSAQLESKIREEAAKLSAEARRAAEPVLEIAEEVVDFRENLVGYHGTGLQEKRIPEVRKHLANYEAALASKLQKNPEIQPVAEIAQELVAMPIEQISWYELGVNFLKRGIAYNREKYDLYFELGWTYYNRGLDYENAARYLELAIRFPHPGYVINVLAHAQELNGNKERALELWEKQLDTGFRAVAERAIRAIKADGAFSPRLRKEMGLEN